MTAKIDEGKLLGGLVLVGVSIWEFSTNYLTDNFLVPYQDTQACHFPRPCSHLSGGILTTLLYGLIAFGQIRMRRIDGYPHVSELTATDEFKVAS